MTPFRTVVQEIKYICSQVPGRGRPIQDSIIQGWGKE
jgi:hypothetical protein